MYHVPLCKSVPILKMLSCGQCGSAEIVLKLSQRSTEQKLRKAFPSTVLTKCGVSSSSNLIFT